MMSTWENSGVIGYESGGYTAETSANLGGTPAVIYAEQTGYGGRYIGIAIYNAKTGAVMSSTSGYPADAYCIYTNNSESGWEAGTAVQGVAFDSKTGFIYVLFSESGNTYQDSGFGIAVFQETSSGTAVSHVTGNVDYYTPYGPVDSYLSYGCCHATEATPDFFRYPAGIAIDNNFSTNTQTQLIITGSNMNYDASHEGIGDDAAIWQLHEDSSGNGSLDPTSDVYYAPVSGTPSGNFGAVTIDPNSHDVFTVFNGSSIIEGNDNGGGLLSHQSTYTMSGITWIGVANSADQWETVSSTNYPLLVVLDSNGQGVDTFYGASVVHFGSTMTPYDYSNYGREQTYLYMDPVTGNFATVDNVNAQFWTWGGSGFTNSGGTGYLFPDPYSYTNITQPLVVLAFDSCSGLPSTDDLVVLNVSNSGTSLWGEY
jgi:hypothetical protein